MCQSSRMCALCSSNCVFQVPGECTGWRARSSSSSSDPSTSSSELPLVSNSSTCSLEGRETSKCHEIKHASDRNYVITCTCQSVHERQGEFELAPGRQGAAFDTEALRRAPLDQLRSYGCSLCCPQLQS